MQKIDENLESKLKSIIASMSFEGLDLTEAEIEECRKIFYGEISSGEAVARVLARYEKNSTQD